MQFIDNFLDRITMYRLVLYYLIFLILVAGVFGMFGILPYNPLSIMTSSLILVGVCYVTNKIFAKVFNAPTNFESVYITALILALIISPIKSSSDLPLLIWAGVLAMSSKYIFAINKKHIFNPAAIAVTLTALGFSGSASWWIGTLCMLPFSLLGLLIVRKIRRYDLVFYFFISAFSTMGIFVIFHGGNLLTTLKQVLVSSPIFFFATVMLTEPLTTPATKNLQSIYAALVGVLFVPQFHLGSYYTTPEQALVLGNIFSYFVSPKYKIVTLIKEKIQRGSDIVEFIFPLQNKIDFLPGQYMEWTLPHKNPDSRGNRRYFTIASSPTEENLLLGVRLYQNSSSYKKAMFNSQNSLIVGSQITGDFTLPKNPNQKLVFVAGGIGITPFRSMVKYLIDTNQTRNIIILYSNKYVSEIVYSEVFAQAQKLGIKTVYTLTDTAQIPANWQGKIGRINSEMILREVPDFKERIFYISGSQNLIVGIEKVLNGIRIPKNHIKKDFFPGLV